MYGWLTKTPKQMKIQPKELRRQKRDSNGKAQSVGRQMQESRESDRWFLEHRSLEGS